jgi:hypothetical protein
MHTDVYLNNKDHLDRADSRIEITDEIMMSQSHNNVLRVPMKTRSVSQEDYDHFVGDCKLYWCWLRNKRRITTTLWFKHDLYWRLYDPIIHEWFKTITALWRSLDTNDLTYLHDLEMGYALFNGELYSWEMIPPVNPSNGRVWVV